MGASVILDVHSHVQHCWSRGMVISNGSRTDSRQSRGKSRLSAAPEASSFTGRATRGFSNQMRARRDVCGFSICACANYDVSMRIMSSASSAHSSLTASFLLLPRMTSAAAHLCYGLLLRLWISWRLSRHDVGYKTGVGHAW
jgi:hypothetical protein